MTSQKLQAVGAETSTFLRHVGAPGFVRSSPASGPPAETTFRGLPNAGVPEVWQSQLSLMTFSFQSDLSFELRFHVVVTIVMKSLLDRFC